MTAADLVTDFSLAALAERTGGPARGSEVGAAPGDRPGSAVEVAPVAPGGADPGGML